MFSYIIIGVQHTGDILSQVPVQDSLDVAANVDCTGENRLPFKVIGHMLRDEEHGISGGHVQSLRLNSQGALADHNLMVFTTLFL